MSPLSAAEILSETSPELAQGGALLLLAGLALTPLCVSFARGFAPEASVFFARWRFLHAAFVGLCLAVLMRVVPAGLASWLEPEGVPEILRQLASSALALGGASLAAVLIAARLDPDGVRSLGLRGPGSLRAALVGLGCYVLLCPGILGAALLWPWLFEQLGGRFEPQEIAVAIGALDGTSRVLAGVFAILVLPCFEELIFRGFLQPLFVQNLGDRGGVFVTSLVFALLHGDSALLPILALSLLLGSLKLCTQRLSACIAVHALHNAVVFAMLGA
ncbi:MAG: CPBP family intramembrane metalloprotease [Planctomycetes bacterium]|nr:CPBP family intramembrane metalloprotease [Planctomycetota bacterium]